MNTTRFIQRLLGLAALGVILLAGSCPAWAQAPINDNFANAIILTGSSATSSGSNVGASRETGEPYHDGLAGGGHSVWWAWTAPISGSVTISLAGSSFDTVLAVYTGSSVSALSYVTANDDYYGAQSRVDFIAVAGTQYQIAVDGYSSVSVGSIQLALTLTGPLNTISVSAAPSNGGSVYGGGAFANNSIATLSAAPAPGYYFVNWTESGNVASTSSSYQFSVSGDRNLVANFAAYPAPANDNFANRALLTGSDSVNSQYATRENGEPYHAGYSGGKSVWWTWTAPVSGPATLGVNTSFWYPLLAVYSGTSLDTLSPVASEVGYSNSSLPFHVTRGSSYQIAIDDYYGSGGNINISIAPPPGPAFELPTDYFAAKSKLAIPVQLNATGDENTISFSVNFDGSALKFQSVALGENDGGATLSVDSTQAAQGQLGITIAQPPGVAFGSGPQNIVYLQFAPVGQDADLDLTFADFPVARTVTASDSGSLAATYNDGQLWVRANGDIVLSADPSDAGTLIGAGTFPVGSTRTIKAKPAPGWIFAGWNDGDLSASRRVKVVPEGLSYTASFLPSPALWKGAYSGSLDSDTPSLAKVTLGGNGGFSGSIQLNGHTYRFHGKLDADGNYQGQLSSPKGWILGLSLDTYSGTFSGDLWADGNDYSLSLSRSMRNSLGGAPDQAGRYTFQLQPNYYDDSAPKGIGFGTLTVSKNGAVRMVGKLGDGTPFTQSGLLSETAQWQVYIPLYQKTGYLSGLLNFESLDNSDLDGSLNWYKPQRPSDKAYVQGIYTEVSLQGSLFTEYKTFADDFSWSSIAFHDSSMGNVYQDNFSLSKGENFLATTLNMANQNAQIRINPKDGTLSGTLFGVYLDTRGRPIATPVHGVLLQKTMSGGGIFFDGIGYGQFNF